MSRRKTKPDSGGTTVHMADRTRSRSTSQVANDQSGSDATTTFDEDMAWTNQTRTIHRDAWQSTTGYPTPPDEVPAQENESTSSVSTAALDVLGRRSKELMNGMRSLRELGIEDLNLPLPIIVVVGDQSAGKSSVIEALSELRVPRSHGTCTRCPLEINLTHEENPNAEWKCTVSLHKKYDYYPNSNKNGTLFRSWVPNRPPSPDFIFETIQDKDDLEASIKWAQIATLNPSTHPSKYQLYKEGNVYGGSGIQVQFSPNVVKLRISGPGLPNLSFVDLPGIINQSPDGEGDDDLVLLVRELVRSYVETKNTLVLLACSLEVDLHVSTAAGMVRTLGADRRTLCVLTKPDRLPYLSPDDSLLHILQNERFKFEYGYFVTKQPSQRELDQGISHSLARKQEQQFFETTEPWKSQLSACRGRFGTHRLQEVLSYKLTSVILQDLPKITESVRSKIFAIDARLSQLPEPPVNSLQIVSDLLSSFKAAVERDMKGEFPHNDFMKKWRKSAEICHSEMGCLRPKLIIRTEAESVKKADFDVAKRDKVAAEAAKRGDIMEIDSGPEDEAPQTPLSKGKRPQVVQYNSPSSAKRLRSVDIPTLEARARKNGLYTRNDLALHAYSPTLGHAKKFTLDELRDILRSASDQDIPDVTNPKVFALLINQSIEHWDVPLHELLKATEEQIRGQINRTMLDLLQPWETTQLSRDAMESIHTFLTRVLDTIKVATNAVTKLEKFKPMSLNQKCQKWYQGEEFAAFLKARNEWRANLYLDEAENGKWTTGTVRDDKVKRVKAEDLGEDEYLEEITVFSKVRSYYSVASDRLVDHVFQSIQYHVFESCRVELYQHLVDDLRIHEHDGFGHCQALLAEDPQREEERRALKNQKERLERALQTLEELGKEHGS